jgi:hypothetical protein
MVIIVEILLTLFVIFQIKMICSTIKNGRYLIGSSILPVKELIRSLQILEHTNPNAFLRMKFIDSFQVIRIYKKQDRKNWWFECSVPIKNENIFNQIVIYKGITKNTNFIPGGILADRYKFFMGSDSNDAFEMITQYFYKVHKCKPNSKIQVLYRKTRVEESISDTILNN